MIYTLIGMSNLGKTHWAERLKNECDFQRIDCDVLVEAKLGPELRSLGYSGIEDVAKWMGFPYDTQYSQTSQEFVRCEREVMLEIIDQLRSSATDRLVVIDTCGSVIYTGEEVIASLRELSTVVYLEASLEHRRELFERYIAEPKPVVWGDNAFAPNPSEASAKTLERCYPTLLQKRAERYEAMSHVKVPFEHHRASGATPFDIFPELVAPINLNPPVDEVVRKPAIPRS